MKVFIETISVDLQGSNEITLCSKHLIESNAKSKATTYFNAYECELQSKNKKPESGLIFEIINN